MAHRPLLIYRENTFYLAGINKEGFLHTEHFSEKNISRKICFDFIDLAYESHIINLSENDNLEGFDKLLAVMPANFNEYEIRKLYSLKTSSKILLRYRVISKKKLLSRRISLQEKDWGIHADLDIWQWLELAIKNTSNETGNVCYLVQIDSSIYQFNMQSGSIVKHRVVNVDEFPNISTSASRLLVCASLDLYEKLQHIYENKNISWARFKLSFPAVRNNIWQCNNCFLPLSFLFSFAIILSIYLSYLIFLNFSYKDTSLQTNKFINIMQHQNLNMPANTYLSEIKFENNLLTLSGYFLTEGGFIKLKDNMHSCWSFTKKENNMFVAHYV